MNKSLRLKSFFINPYKSRIHPGISFPTLFLAQSKSHKSPQKRYTWLFSLLISTYTSYNLYNQAHCNEDQIPKMTRDRLEDGKLYSFKTGLSHSRDKKIPKRIWFRYVLPSNSVSLTLPID